MTEPFRGEDAWLEELPGLVAGGPTTPYRARWWDRDVGGSATTVMRWNALGFMLGDRAARQTEVALFERTATTGAVPLVLVPVAEGSMADGPADGALVEVRGTVAAGRPLVLLLPQQIVPCVGPARVPLRWRRRHRL